MGVIRIEGKSMTLDDQIIDAGPEAIKAALSVDFPDVENAHIEVIGSSAPGVVRTASVVKQGTGKGLQEPTEDGRQATVGVRSLVTGQVLEALLAAPEYVNPAIELAAEVQQLELRGHAPDLEKLLRSPRVETAIVAGEKEGRAVMQALRMCGQAPPVASKIVPVGF